MELDLTTIERIERFIAFEGRVWLNSWSDTSSHGFKITLGLSSRADLDAFDKTMKRRKRRGGQRYHMILTAVTEISEAVQQEAQFCGRGWRETSGAHIALHIPHLSDQHWWREQKSRDQEGKCSTWNIILMEIGDDEIIIDQTMRERAEQAELLPKGGPRSKAVAMLLQDDDFQTWLQKHSIHGGSGFGHARFIGHPDAVDVLMKEVCGIKSKVEFDNGNEKAWEIWENQFHRPFIQYMKRASS